MATTIDDCDRAVQRAFEEALAIVHGASTKPLHDIETSLWSALLAQLAATPTPTRAHDASKKAA